jgi:hypothetical protein
MRTGPLVDALIEHLVGDLVRYALENGFHVVVEDAVLARADPRARGVCGYRSPIDYERDHQADPTAELAA